MTTPRILQARDISFSYDQVRLVLSEVSLDLYAGESLGIIGPNGCGKTTLLKLLTSILPLNEGLVELKDRPLRTYTKRELAKLIGVVEQEGMLEQIFSVEEVVAMGRYPWMKRFSALREHDYQAINEALTTFELWDMRDKSVARLSGGERQLVSLARVMAQDPEILVLDEPTTYLDIGNQLLLMQHVRTWQREKKLTIMMVLHDLNLVAQYCDRLLLLNQRGEIAATGSVSEVLTADNIEAAYGIRPYMTQHPETGVPQILV